MPEKVLELPLRVILTNSSSVAVGFIPYRENFVKAIPAGDTYSIQVNGSEEAQYYIGQATTGFTVISEEIPYGIVPSITFDPGTDTYITTATIEFNCADKDGVAAIYYTVDGSEPDEESTEYDRDGSGVVVDATTTIKAVAYDDAEYAEHSLITSVTITIQVATPVADIVGDSYVENQSVTLSCDTPDATIYYTTDGNAPTTGSTEYTEAISITGSSGSPVETVLKAIAVKAGLSDSAVMTETYTITLP